MSEISPRDIESVIILLGGTKAATILFPVFPEGFGKSGVGGVGWEEKFGFPGNTMVYVY